MSASNDIRAFAKKAGGIGDAVVRKVVIDFTTDLVRATPVDTGNAKSNWFWGLQRESAVVPSTSKSGAPSINGARAFAPSVTSKTPEFWITNNVEYIMALEYGHSKQAPSGMARITADRWQIILNKAAQVFA